MMAKQKVMLRHDQMLIYVDVQSFYLSSWLTRSNSFALRRISSEFSALLSKDFSLRCMKMMEDVCLCAKCKTTRT